VHALIPGSQMAEPPWGDREWLERLAASAQGEGRSCAGRCSHRRFSSSPVSSDDLALNLIGAPRLHSRTADASRSARRARLPGGPSLDLRNTHNHDYVDPVCQATDLPAAGRDALSAMRRRFVNEAAVRRLG